MPNIGIDARKLLIENPSPHTNLFQCLLQENYLSNYPFSFFIYTNPKNNYQPDYLDADNVFVRPIKSNTSSEFWWLNRDLANAMQQDRINLFLSPYYKFPIFSSVPSFGMIHDLAFFTNSPTLLARKRRSIVQRSSLYLKFFLFCRLATKIITVSHYSSKAIQRILKVPPSKIEICFNGISPVKNINFNSNLLSNYQIEKKGYFLYIGSNIPKKNLKNIVSAYAKLEVNIRNKYPLVLRTSKGPEFSLVKQLGIEKNVIYIEQYLTESEKHLLLNNALALLLISFEEGFGIPAAEAMSVGTPPIVSSESAVSEIVSDAGFKAYPDREREITQALKKMALLSQEEYRLQSQRSLEVAKQFSQKAVADRLATIIDNFFNKSR